MTVRLKGTERDVVTIRWIPKYTAIERVGHWLHTATFVPLAITGLILYVPPFQSLAQGQAGHFVRLVHRVTAILFGLLPILYFIIEPRRFVMSIREFLFDKDDIGWVLNAFSYYLLGRHAAMPPQGRFSCTGCHRVADVVWQRRCARRAPTPWLRNVRRALPMDGAHP
jgi:cytochrome b subunit of formate dehydrogenase